MLLLTGGTQYGNAFIKAFELLKGSGSSLQDNFRRKKVILFLTDGKPNDDKGRIMQIIKDKNVEQSNSVIIMKYGMLVYAPILLDIANQDGTSYGVSKEPGVTVSGYIYVFVYVVSKRFVHIKRKPIDQAISHPASITSLITT